MDEQNALEWKRRTCCFSGHRILSKEEQQSIRLRLPTVLQKLINEGYCCFAAGGAKGFDTIAALTVLELREMYPHIRLLLILPCKDQDARWRKKEQELYQTILQQADDVIYTSDFYFNGCMHIRNRALVAASSCCIAFLRDGTPAKSGTVYTVKHAREEGLKVENLSDKR
ncbi:MAG: DUF1273 family protein [Oscillospiraceae bacterium]|nr:DUF1273 family protein [Oscillospiraceae bacterium]